MSEQPQILFPSPEAILTHADPVIRIMGRGAIAAWTEAFQAWVNDELKRSDRTQVLIAVTRLLVLTHSSLAANMLKESGFQAMASGFKDLIDEDYVKHAQQCLVAVQQTRKGR